MCTRSALLRFQVVLSGHARGIGEALAPTFGGHWVGIGRALAGHWRGIGAYFWWALGGHWWALAGIGGHWHTQAHIPTELPAFAACIQKRQFS